MFSAGLPSPHHAQRALPAPLTASNKGQDSLVTAEGKRRWGRQGGLWEYSGVVTDKDKSHHSENLTGPQKGEALCRTRARLSLLQTWGLPFSSSTQTQTNPHPFSVADPWTLGWWSKFRCWGPHAAEGPWDRRLHPWLFLPDVSKQLEKRSSALLNTKWFRPTDGSTEWELFPHLPWKAKPRQHGPHGRSGLWNPSSVVCPKDKRLTLDNMQSLGRAH